MAEVFLSEKSCWQGLGVKGDDTAGPAYVLCSQTMTTTALPTVRKGAGREVNTT